MTPSKYQAAIFNAIFTPGNLVVEAGPGSGKTTTMVELNKIILNKDPSAQILNVAFSKKIAEALKGKLPAKSQASTLHSLGLRICNRAWNGCRLDNDKLKTILNTTLDKHPKLPTENSRKRFQKMYGWTILEICRLMKLRCVLDVPVLGTILNIAKRYGVEFSTNGDTPLVIELIQTVFETSRQQTVLIDFADMLYLPVFHDLPLPAFDYLLVDEAQDLNPTQAELVKRLAENGAKIVAVGDRKQSVFAFAGADVRSIQNLTEKLVATTLPLSLCYRSSKAVVAAANRVYPGTVEALPDAPEGSEQTVKHDKLHDLVAAGDFVICRTTAPLIDECLESIRRGHKATVVGRDIGAQIAAMAKKIDAKYQVGSFLAKVRQYQEAEEKKILAAAGDDGDEAARELDRLNDRVATIFALLDGADTLNALLSRIERIFSDANPADAIQYMTAHRSKGLEANRVFIIHPHLMPLSYAKSDEDREQEKNILFVASSRAKLDLYWVQYK